LERATFPRYRLWTVVALSCYFSIACLTENPWTRAWNTVNRALTWEYRFRAMYPWATDCNKIEQVFSFCERSRSI
jgi:hypothetical protein